MPPRPSGKRWSLEQSPLPRRVSWHRLNRRAAGKVSEIEAATAGTTGHEKARRQRQILGDAKPRLKTRKEITKALESARVSMRCTALGAWGGGMNIDPENYSKYTLRRFAAMFDVICWVLIAVVTVGICMFIEWWTA
jgi:hypothetical protein